MITINTDPVIFSIGHFTLRWYALIVLAAIIVGVWLTAREAQRRGFKREDIYDGAVWVVVGGLLGARLFHVLDHWPHTFAANPIRALYVWEGGLAIWGGVAGGLIAAAFLARRRGWHLPRLLDAVVPGLALAQAIGRVAKVLYNPTLATPDQLLAAVARAGGDGQHTYRADRLEASRP